MPQQNAYSGVIGQNPHTYDRWGYASPENECFSYVDEIMDCIAETVIACKRHDVSRLIMHLNVDETVHVSSIYQSMKRIELIPLYDTPKKKLIVGANLDLKRELSHQVRTNIMATVEHKIAGALQDIAQEGGFENFALAQLDTFKKQGLRFDTKASEDELFDLWGDTYGWSRELCQLYADKPFNLQKSRGVFVGKSPNGEVLSGILIEGDESTEAKKKPSNYANTFLPVFIFSFAYAINKGIQRIRADIKYDTLAKGAIKGGMRLVTSYEDIPAERFVMANHAEVYGKPDYYNAKATTVFKDGSKLQDMRSFIGAYLDVDRYTPKVIESYLEYYEKYQ